MSEESLLTSQQYASIQKELCPRCHSSNLVKGKMSQTQQAKRECLECGATWTALFIIQSHYVRAGYEHFEGPEWNPYTRGQKVREKSNDGICGNDHRGL